jgi:hypothetical protein
MGVVTFPAVYLIHTATLYTVGSGGAYSVTGASFACRLCVLPRASAPTELGVPRSELSNRRLLLCLPAAPITNGVDVQLAVVDADNQPLDGVSRWNPDGQVEDVTGPDGEGVYRRVEVLKVLS